MKRISYLIIVLISLFAVSCEKNISTEDTSKITHYVNFQLEEGSVYAVPLNSTYADPGFTATEGTTDVTSSVVVTGTVDASTLGVYTILYSAKNVDGYEASTTRTVVVYDPNAPADDFSGTYSSTIVRTEGDGTNPRVHGGIVNITKVGQGVFYVDCLLGSIYSVDYGYGSAYAMTGYIALQSDNSLIHLSSYVAGWGDGLEGFQNGNYNPGTGIPYWESIYANGDIYAVTLN